MRKIILAAILISMFSCSSYKVIFVVPYNNYGLFITEANSVSFAYEPIGSVEAMFVNYKHAGTMGFNPSVRWYTEALPLCFINR